MSNRHPAWLALSAQLSALLLVAAAVWLAARMNTPLSIWTAAFTQGGLAALLGQCLGLRRWWLLFNVLFVPGLIALQGQQWPAGWFLLAFVLLLLLNWNSLAERVPLYLSGRRTCQVLIQRLSLLPEGFRFVDLGCGLGSALVRVARAYPQARVVGVETAPLVFALAWLRCLPYRNCCVRYRSLWDESLLGYDAVYCFLSPAPMAELWVKARQEMKAGGLLISNSFAVPDHEPDEVCELHDWRDSRLLIWRL